MKHVLKQNPVLVFGLGLPLLMVGVFALVAGLARVNTPPPQYDVVFAANYYKGYGMVIQVQKGHLQVSVPESSCNYGQAQLYRYSPKSESIEEIPIKLPQELVLNKPADCTHAQGEKIITIPVPQLEDVTLSDNSISPDGYQFLTNDYRHNSAGLLADMLFNSTNYYTGPVLRKARITYRLPENQGYYNSVQFIGWVVS